MVFYTETRVFYTGEPPAALQYRKRAFQYRNDWFSILKRAFSILESRRGLSSIENARFSIGMTGFGVRMKASFELGTQRSRLFN